MSEVRQVFISHSNKDAAQAAEVCRVLEANGVKCWIAPRDIVAGAEWADVIVKAISNSDIVILLVSSASVQSKQVLREVECAVSQERRLVPVRIEKVEITGALKYFLGVCHWIDAFEPPLEERARELVSHLAGSGVYDKTVHGSSWSGPQALDVDSKLDSSKDRRWVMPVIGVVVIVLSGALLRSWMSAAQPDVPGTSNQPKVQVTSGEQSPSERPAVNQLPSNPADAEVPLKLIDTSPSEDSPYCIIEHTDRGTQDVFSVGESVWNEGTLERVGSTWVEINRNGKILRFDWKTAAGRTVAGTATNPKGPETGGPKDVAAAVPLKIIDIQPTEGAMYSIIEHTERGTQDVFSIGESVWGEGTLKAINPTSVTIERNGEMLVMDWKADK